MACIGVSKWNSEDRKFRPSMLKLIISFLLSTSIYCNTLVYCICNQDYKRFHYQLITSSPNLLAAFVTLKGYEPDAPRIAHSSITTVVPRQFGLHYSKPHQQLLSFIYCRILVHTTNTTTPLHCSASLVYHVKSRNGNHSSEESQMQDQNRDPIGREID